MKRRIICGFLAVILALQPIPKGVYGMENSAISVENVMEDSKTAETPKVSSFDSSEMSKKEVSEESMAEGMEGSEEESKEITTEISEEESEENTTEVSEEESRENTTEVSKEESEENTTEVSGEESGENTAEVPEEDSTEESTAENTEGESAEESIEEESGENVTEGAEEESETSSVSSSDLNVSSGEKEDTTVSSNTIEEANVETVTEEAELATFSNISAEKIGYQYARIVMDIEFAEDVTVNEYYLYGGVVCSEDSLSTTTEYTSGVERLFKYRDENGNYVKNRFYIDVKVHGEQKYTYTPFVQVTDADGAEQIVSAKDSVEITGKKFEDLSPGLRFDSGITKAILWLDLTEYDYGLDTYLNSDIYYREKGSDSWKESGSLDSESGKVTIEGLTASSEYEVYVELTSKNETEKKVSSNICSFTTEKEIIYTSSSFPDTVFYEYILGRCGGEQITQSKLNEIVGITITEDNITNNIPIKSIDGIQYLNNLEEITITGQDITDASMISGLKYLESVSLKSNELTSLPDMSEMIYLYVINFNYNKIPESEIVESKLPENSSCLGTLNWTEMAEHQLDDVIKIKAPEVCFGWGTSQPIVLGISNLKTTAYTLEANVNGTIVKTVVHRGNTDSINSTDYKVQGCVIPNTGLQPGTYEDVTVKIYDCYGREKVQSIIDITLMEDATTLSTHELGIGSTSFFIQGELLGTSQRITSIKLLKENEVYGESSSYVSSYSTYGESRYKDFLYGDTIAAEIDESLFACERNAIAYLTSIIVSKTLVEGDYDLEFTLEDGITITEQNIIHINEETRVYSLDDANALGEYKNIYSNSGDYVYVTLRGYNLNTEKVYPEIYMEDTVLTTYDGLELVEETGTAGMKYYVYRLKKLETDKYWKKSRDFRWRLCIAEGYQCQDLATEHGYSYTYDNGIELELFWVDDHLTKNTCKLYIKSSLPDNTPVKVTAYEDSSYSIYKAGGMGVLNNGIIIFDLYNEAGELFYPSLNSSRFTFEFSVGENIIKIKAQPIVYYCLVGMTYGTEVDSELPGVYVHTFRDDTTEPVYGIQWGTDTLESYGVNFYLPNTNEKKLSLNLSEDRLGKYKSYLFTQDDIKDLDPTEIYRIEVTDKSGVRLLERFYARVTSKVEESTEVILPTKVTLNTTSASLKLNQTIQLKATISPTNATNKSITWSSDNTNVATVDTNGLVRTVGYGKAVIKATTVNGKTASCTVTVASIEPKGIKLSQTKASMKLGNTLQLTATINPENATDKTVVWTSDNTESVIVNEDGLVTAVNPGKAVIKAGTINGKQASCTVIAYNPDGEEIPLKPGEVSQIQLPAGISSKGLKYLSDNTSVATVSSKGLITAVGIGTANITLQSGDILITYSVTVTNPLQSISFEESEIVMKLGENVTNSIVFDPVYTDSNKTLTVTVEEETIASAEIVNEKIVKITALSEGTTTVKVTCGELEANCKVTVQNSVEIPDISQHMVYALTNRHKTLADISSQLLPGFEFQNPEIVLSKFAGESEKEFAVIYTDESGRTAPAVQNVKLITISGISSSIDMQSIEVGNEEKATLRTTCLWTGFEANADVKEKILQDYEFEVTSNKEGIVEIQNNGENFSLCGIKAGKVKFTIILREKGTQGKTGILYQEKLNFIVSEKAADIQIEVIGASYNEEKDYYYISDITSAAVSVKAVAEDYKLTWSSSDTGIAKVEKAVNGISKVTLKNNGKVKLTVTANDAGKTSKSILFYIIDTKPSVDTAMTINKAHENGGTIGIYASYGYDIRQYDVQLMQKEDKNQSDERFAIDYNSEKDTYEVVILDQNKVSQGKYAVIVKVTAVTEEGEQEYYSDLLITVINKPVTYTVKQSKKVNLFYTDEEGNGTLNISCKNAEIEAVELSDCDFFYDLVTGSLSYDGSDYENIDKTGVLNIKFKDYAQVSKNITISTETKKPSVIMSATSSVLYPNVGIKKAQIQIKDKNTKKVFWVENRNINQENLEKDAYYVYASKGEVYLQLKENVEDYPKTAKVKFALQLDNWNDEITFTHTIKCQLTNNPTLALSSSTLTLNKNASVARYQEANVDIKIKNATESNIINDVIISGADKKALGAMNQGVDFDFETETGILTARFNNSNVVNKGTYNYNVRTEIAENKSITTKMKVSVIDKDTTISVKAKGTIDILNRNNSSIVCTPQLKNISGKIIDVSLTGTDAHLFNVELDDVGKTIITAKDDVAYITKYPYKVQLVYTLKSGERPYMVNSKPITIKVKQGTINLVSSLSSSQLYQAADNFLNINLTAINASGESLEIKDVSLVEAKNMKGAFEVCYSESANSYQLSLKDATKVKKGKNYSVKLNIKFAGQADNEKAKTITVKVTVK